ncbi:hypothetical protein [Streptomyces sioyaensis]|uniref:hypothetical protein n=1 Tax=Streptomyces sioyaensis TaxID=67364 RepID=UPI0037ABB948
MRSLWQVTVSFGLVALPVDTTQLPRITGPAFISCMPSTALCTPIPTPDSSVRPPALAVFNDQLYSVIRSSNGMLSLASFDGRSWSPFRECAAPALAVYNDTLYCVYRGYLKFPMSGESPPQSDALPAPE